MEGSGLLGIHRIRVLSVEKIGMEIGCFRRRCALCKTLKSTKSFSSSSLNSFVFAKFRKIEDMAKKLVIMANTFSPCLLTLKCVRIHSSSQVTVAIRNTFPDFRSVLFEIEIPCILLFLNRNKNS